MKSGLAQAPSPIKIDTLNGKLVITSLLTSPDEMLIHITDASGETTYMEYHAVAEHPFKREIQLTQSVSCFMTIRVKCGQQSATRTITASP